MGEEQAIKLLWIMAQAHDGCTSCVYAQYREFKKLFPGFRSIATELYNDMHHPNGMSRFHWHNHPSFAHLNT